MDTKKYLTIFFAFVLGTSALAASFAAYADSPYIYRKRINWVKVIKPSPREFSQLSFQHPNMIVTVEQMEGMLLSIKINKKFLLKKAVKTLDVFSPWEAQVFAPHLVTALRQATADTLVNFSVVHKRPVFILRVDRLSMGYLWAAEDGIHFRFTKLFAKLEGDYEASQNTDKALRRAKTMRVTLEAGPGQKLSYDSATEVIMDPSFDYVLASPRDSQSPEETPVFKGEEKRTQKKEKKVASHPQQTPAPAQSSPDDNAAERLKEIEKLKKDKLITPQEYENLRKKILSEI